jgi:2-polyprenyl-3-methyl-5-hydroxy-6-metoxy-1,4-benzoquinol methylase
MTRAQHWDKIYQAKDYEDVSWFTPHLETSLQLIESAKLDPATAQIIDVGGGRSTLVDDLLDRGYQRVTVLDISEAAIEQTKQRLGDRAAPVT